MKSNCKSFFFFITISFGSGIIHPVRKIILELERGKAAPRHQVDLKKSVALEKIGGSGTRMGRVKQRNDEA